MVHSEKDYAIEISASTKSFIRIQLTQSILTTKSFHCYMPQQAPSMANRTKHNKHPNRKHPPAFESCTVGEHTQPKSIAMLARMRARKPPRFPTFPPAAPRSCLSRLRLCAGANRCPPWTSPNRVAAAAHNEKKGANLSIFETVVRGSWPWRHCAMSDADRLGFRIWFSRRREIRCRPLLPPRPGGFSSVRVVFAFWKCIFCNPFK